MVDVATDYQVNNKEGPRLLPSFLKFTSSSKIAVGAPYITSTYHTR